MWRGCHWSYFFLPLCVLLFLIGLPCLIMPFWFLPTFSGRQLGHKSWTTYNVFNVVKIHMYSKKRNINCLNALVWKIHNSSFSDPTIPPPVDAVASYIIVLVVVFCIHEACHFCELLSYVKIRPYFPPSWIPNIHVRMYCIYLCLSVILYLYTVWMYCLIWLYLWLLLLN